MNLYVGEAVCQYLLCRIIKPSIGKVLPCRCTFSDDLKPFLLKYRIPTFFMQYLCFPNPLPQPSCKA